MTKSNYPKRKFHLLRLLILFLVIKNCFYPLIFVNLYHSIPFDNLFNENVILLTYQRIGADGLYLRPEAVYRNRVIE